jgi:hypothetical protein
MSPEAPMPLGGINSAFVHGRIEVEPEVTPNPYRGKTMDELTLIWNQACDADDQVTTGQLEAIRLELAQEAANIDVSDEDIAEERRRAEELGIALPKSDIDLKLSIHRFRTSQL